MIRVQNLSKFYSSKRALGPVSFDIQDGETVGFLGLNGTGKTTALRILACDLRPSSGTVAIGSVDAVANPQSVRAHIGFLPENPPLYLDMTVGSYLDFAGKLRGMSSAKVKQRLPEVLEVTHLTETSDDLIGTLSHGFRQRVGVAQAIIHNPQLLILDEPTRGLDPVQIVEMRNMVHALKQSHTVLISSHILTEISQTCDRLLVLGNGKIIAAGSEEGLAADMTSAKRVEVMIRAAEDTDAVIACLTAVEGVTGATAAAAHADTQLYTIECSTDVRPDIGRALVEGKYDLLRLTQAHDELENVFLKLVKGRTDASN